MQHDHHVIAWVKAKFNVNVRYSFTYVADKNHKSSWPMSTAYGAFLDYCSCYDGELFDKVTA